MHRDIGATIEQRGFQFFDKQTLAANSRQRPIENLVAASGHAKQFDASGRIQGLQAGLDEFGLPQGEAGFAGGNHNALRLGVHLGTHSVKRGLPLW